MGPQLVRNNSIMARPLSPTGHEFGNGITGQSFDPTNLADPDKVKQFIHSETGRSDLKFGEFTWLSYFKLLFLLFEIIPLLTLSCRPNMRIVNKFQEGRAFVVGGAYPFL